MKTISIITCCDADPDRERFGAKALRGVNVPLCWDGVFHGLPRLLNACSTLQDDFGRAPSFTWLLRADHQIKALMGQSDAAYLQFKKFWDERASHGDELGWHPHHWRITDNNGLWQQELNDKTWMARHLVEAYESLSRHIPLHTVKTGWCFMDETTLKTFRKLGLRAEVSAMPLQVYHPTQEIGRAFYGDYDWQHTGFEPYVPDTQDYRRAANIEEANKKNTSELIEIPISAGSDKLITLIENWTLALRRRQWPRQRIGQSYTSLKITFAPWLFRRLWQGFLPQLENLREPFVHTYFHPDETLPITGRQAWMYSSKNAQSNFQTILKTCRAKGWATKFVTAQEYTRAISPQLGLIPADFKKIESAQGES